MEDWKECKFSDLYEIPSRNGLSKPSRIRGSGYKMINMGELFSNDRIYNIPMELVPLSDSEKETAKIERDDLLFARQSLVAEGAGKCSIVFETDELTVFESHLIRVRLNKNIASPLFYYYYFKSRNSPIKAIIQHCVQAGIKGSDLAEITVKLPPLPTQQKIAKVLSSLDDKIELNNKINANLEQQAQALFKSWFVDFEPFGGEMPAEWKMGKLSDVIEITINGDWGKDEPIGTNTEEVFCIRGADIPEVKIGNKGKMPTRYILPKNWNQKKLTDGDLVVEISGGSPTQSTGRVAYISNALLDRYNNKIICTNFCKAVKPQKNLSMYVYYLWQHLYNKDVFFNYENGTTGVKNLDMNGILLNEDIVIPSEDYLKKFNDFCSLVFKEIFANGNETEKLSNLRDTLLPKLMNGEIKYFKR